MALLKTRCPECNAGLKSATGFNVGQTVCCPKCETYFAVEEPDEEKEKEDEEKEKEGATKKPVKASAADEDDGNATPKKKKKKAYDEDEEPTRSYKNSPLRYAVLGVLVVVMLVLGYLLYDKRKTERELADANESSSSGGNVQIPPPPAGPNPVRPVGPIGPIPVPNPKFPKGKQPPPNDKGGGGPPLPFIGTASSATPAQLGKFKSDLVGTWTADLGDGVTEELAYTATGTFTSKLTGPAPAMISGKYMVTGSVTAKVFKIQLDTPAGSRTVTVTYEDNELQHPTLQPGVTGTFRKK